jgi:chromosome segregation ATPase
MCQLTLQESKTGGDDSEWANTLEQLTQEMISLREEKERILRKAEDLYRRRLHPQEQLTEIHEVLNPLRELIDQFGPLLGRAVDAANGRIGELRLELERIEAQAGWARRSAVGLYILGSILVLAGTALSKVT